MTAIVASDVVYYLSAPSASTGYATTGVAGSSWGGWFSTTALSGTPLDNLFSDITGAETAASQVDYACVFVLNNTASGNSMLNAVAWLPTASYVAGGANVTVAVDTTASSIKTSSSQQALKITSATTAPSGISTWVANQSTVAGGSVSLGTIAPGYVKALWFKRTATNSAAVNNDGFGVQINFDTAG